MSSFSEVPADRLYSPTGPGHPLADSLLRLLLGAGLPLQPGRTGRRRHRQLAASTAGWRRHEGRPKGFGGRPAGGPVGPHRAQGGGGRGLRRPERLAVGARRLDDDERTRTPPPPIPTALFRATPNYQTFHFCSIKECTLGRESLPSAISAYLLKQFAPSNFLPFIRATAQLSIQSMRCVQTGSRTGCNSLSCSAQHITPTRLENQGGARGVRMAQNGIVH